MATRRGDIAKQKITEIIAEAFGNDFVGVVDKKLYVNIPEGNEIVQIAITLTAPKTPIQATAATTSVNSNSSSDDNLAPWEINPKTNTPVDVSQEDKENIKELKKILGIIT